LSFDVARQALHKASERIHEKFYGVRTAGWVSEESLGYTQGDGRVHYTPIPYSALKRLLSAVVPDPGKDVFIDWGSGMGRVLTLASTYAYRRVIGVEYSPALCAAAEQNLKTARVRRRCGEVNVLNVDAREFPIPDDASVMFFYNPFRGELLSEVVQRIHSSWLAHRRPLTFLVSNHAGFIEDTGSAGWLNSLSSWDAYPNTGCTVIRSL
jgi:hypothetical protein